MRALVIATLVLMTGCSASTIDEPSAYQLRDGRQGFRMFGGVSYTASVQEARQVVQSKMDDACGGKAELMRFEALPDETGPIDVVNFDAVAACH
jgi:hypothetical protein